MSSMQNMRHMYMQCTVVRFVSITVYVIIVCIGCRSDEDDGNVGVSVEGVESQVGVAEEEKEVPRIDVEIPRCLAKLGTDQYFVKLPNFLSIETR